jgi:hypothetical protein
MLWWMTRLPPNAPQMTKSHVTPGTLALALASCLLLSCSSDEFPSNKYISTAKLNNNILKSVLKKPKPRLWDHRKERHFHGGPRPTPELVRIGKRRTARIPGFRHRTHPNCLPFSSVRSPLLTSPPLSAATLSPLSPPPRARASFL